MSIETEKLDRCPACGSRAYVYDGRANMDCGDDEYWTVHGKHRFHCTKCGNNWQYWHVYSDYIKNAMKL